MSILVHVSYFAGHEVNDKRYELSNPLGNILEVVTDHKLPTDSNSDGNVDYYLADVVSYSDYYPFGMLMPNRHGNSGDYRYGYNGKESDSEVKGEGNSYDYGFRMQDPRLGRFLSIDPLSNSYPFYTPYQYASNSPISCIDVDGLEGLISTGIPAPFSNSDRPTGMVLTVNDAAKINKRIVVNVFKAAFSEQLPKKLIEHYAYGNGKTVVLNENEMIQLHVSPIGLKSPSLYEQVEQQVAGMKVNETRHISISTSSAYANNSGTLGQFTINIEGEYKQLENGEWEFKGTMQFYDVWDFNVETPKEERERLKKTGISRSAEGKKQTEIASNYLPGKGFKIFSKKINISQTSKDNIFNWFKGKSYAPIKNKYVKYKQEVENNKKSTTP